MTPEHQPALEAQQQVLADRLHPLEPSAVQLFGYPGGGCPRVRALDLDCLPHQHLETTRSAR